MNKTVLTLLGTVRESYDYVLIDLPPLDSVIDAAVVAAKCDGAILVISDHQVRGRKILLSGHYIIKSLKDL